jgi:hypothetical protein
MAIWAIFHGDYYVMGAWLNDIRPPKAAGLLTRTGLSQRLARPPDNFLAK